MKKLYKFILTALLSFSFISVEAYQEVQVELLSEKAKAAGIIEEKSPISRASLTVDYEHYGLGTQVCTDIRIQPGDPTFFVYNSDGTIFIHLDTSLLDPDRKVGTQAFDCVVNAGEKETRRFNASGTGTIYRLNNGQFIVSKVIDDEVLGKVTYEVQYKDLTKLEKKLSVIRSEQGALSAGKEMDNRTIYLINATNGFRNMGMIYSFSETPELKTETHLPHFKKLRVNSNSRFEIGSGAKE